jgi:hypothetical protein
MIPKKSKIVLSTLMFGGLFAASGSAKATILFYEKEGVKAYFSGYAGLDVISDTTQGIDEIVGSAPVARPGTVAGDTGRAIYPSRVSRFAFGILTNRGPTKIKGHVEADFLGYEPAVGNGVSESGCYHLPQGWDTWTTVGAAELLSKSKDSSQLNEEASSLSSGVSEASEEARC